MNPRRNHFAAALGAATLLACTLPRAAHAADKKHECADAYEKGQELRASSKLQQAREALAVCAQAACPAFIESECTQWLNDIQREMPTVVLAALDSSGADAAGVKISMDGQPLAADHEGKAVAVDPGRHVFRFELEGQAPIERELVARQGEKDRLLSVTFGGEGTAPVSVVPTPVATTPAVVDYGERSPQKPGPLRPFAYVAGGVGVAGVVGFTVLGLMSKSQRSDVEGSGCKPNCSHDDIDAIKTKVVLADVSLGVGIAGIGTAVALWFLSEPKKNTEQTARAPVYFDVKPTPGGGYATVFGKF